jgi:hypothetical protein
LKLVLVKDGEKWPTPWRAELCDDGTNVFVVSADGAVMADCTCFSDQKENWKNAQRIVDAINEGTSS